MNPVFVVSPAALARASTRQRPGVPGRRADRPLQPGDRLDVVVEHVGPDGEQQRQRRVVAPGVGDERLDPCRRAAVADRLDAGRHVRHAAVGEIVTRHHREHGVVEAHPIDRLGDARRFVGGRRERMPGVDEAEPARPGAAFAEHHERGRAVGPALRQVGAAGVLAHGDEAEVAHRLLERHHLRAECDLGRNHSGLRVPIDSPSVTPACSSRATARLHDRGQAPALQVPGPRRGRTPDRSRPSAG